MLAFSYVGHMLSILEFREASELDIFSFIQVAYVFTRAIPLIVVCL